MLLSYELHPSLFGDDQRQAQANFLEWIIILAGGKYVNGARPSSTCTSRLAKEMMEHAYKRADFKTALLGMKPPAW